MAAAPPRFLRRAHHDRAHAVQVSVVEFFGCPGGPRRVETPVLNRTLLRDKPFPVPSRDEADDIDIFPVDGVQRERPLWIAVLLGAGIAGCVLAALV